MTKQSFKNALWALVMTLALVTSGCDTDAKRAGENLATAADNFEINRRIVFYNGITDTYMLTIEGLCSVDADNPKKIIVLCKTGPSEFKKHMLGVSDNVTYFVEQLEAAKVSVYNYRVIYKPQNIIPDLQMKVN